MIKLSQLRVGQRIKFQIINTICEGKIVLINLNPNEFIHCEDGQKYSFLIEDDSDTIGSWSWEGTQINLNMFGLSLKGKEFFGKMLYMLEPQNKILEILENNLSSDSRNDLLAQVFLNKQNIDPELKKQGKWLSGASRYSKGADGETETESGFRWL